MIFFQRLKMTIITILKSKEAINEELSVIKGKLSFWVEAKDDLKLIKNDIKQIKELFLKNLKHTVGITKDELENLRVNSIHTAVCYV